MAFYEAPHVHGRMQILTTSAATAARITPARRRASSSLAFAGEDDQFVPRDQIDGGRLPAGSD